MRYRKLRPESRNLSNITIEQFFTAIDADIFKSKLNQMYVKGKAETTVKAKVKTDKVKPAKGKTEAKKKVKAKVKVKAKFKAKKVVKIDKNVPLPEKYAKHSKSRYPFKDMKVGDSIGDIAVDLGKLQRGMTAAASYFIKQNKKKSWKFVSQVNSDKQEVRVWRIK